MDIENAEEYAKNREGQQKVAMDLINRYITWREGDVVLDVGCGTGEITKLMSQQPGVKSVVGIDLSSDFISFASKNNAAENVSFHVADASKSADFKPEWEGAFTKATCFTVLHWIQDKRSAFKNIASCLEPGGELVINCLLESAAQIGKLDLPRWRGYLKDFTYNIYPWPNDDIEGMGRLFEEVGFEVLTCNGQPAPPKSFPTDPEGLKAVMRTMLPQLKFIPTDKQDDYLTDAYCAIAEMRKDFKEGDPEAVVAHVRKV
ncbi:juvenile hormone acid O-methyltransferase-like [Branchiostoma floridae x Branchiostoma belcheri]